MNACDLSAAIMIYKTRNLVEFIYRKRKIYDMELFEIIVWLTIGFVPTLANMEIAWKVAKRRIIERAPMTN